MEKPPGSFDREGYEAKAVRPLWRLHVNKWRAKARELAISDATHNAQLRIPRCCSVSSRLWVIEFVLFLEATSIFRCSDRQTGLLDCH